MGGLKCVLWGGENNSYKYNIVFLVDPVECRTWSPIKLLYQITRHWDNLVDTIHMIRKKEQ